jgi:hypothetical protein
MPTEFKRKAGDAQPIEELSPWNMVCVVSGFCAHDALSCKAAALT